jgi:hypothetical protein
MSAEEHFQRACLEGASPPWEIGRPQLALVEASRRG